MPPYLFIFSDGILHLRNASLKIRSTSCFVTTYLEPEPVDAGEEGDGQTAHQKYQPGLALGSPPGFYQSQEADGGYQPGLDTMPESDEPGHSVLVGIHILTSVSMFPFPVIEHPHPRRLGAN